MALSARTALVLFAFLTGAGCQTEPPADVPPMLGDAQSGARIIARIECGVCHVIPGVRGARGMLGPSLDGFARRAYIAGVVPNRPSVLVQWVRDAPSIAPETLMPELPLSDREAHDVAAYLYTLR
ncbi:MAG: cytochrome C [Candidatus Binatia bacterium]